MKVNLTVLFPRSVLAFCLLAVASLASLGGVSLWLQFVSIDATSEEQLQQPLTQAMGGQFVATADALLSTAAHQARHIASLPETQQAVATPTPQWAEKLRQFIPHARQVTLINRLQLRGLQDELGFALLDIASRAFKLGQTQLEAVYRKGEQHFYIAAPVTGFDHQKGVLLIEFDKSWLTSLDAAAERVSGTIILTQPALDGAGDATAIHHWGSERYLPSDLMAFPLTNGWTASIAVNTQAVALDGINIVLPSAVVMVVALALTTVLLGLLVVHTRNDHQMLMTYLHSVHRQHPQPGQYKLALFQQMAQDLNALLIARAPVLKAAEENSMERDLQQLVEESDWHNPDPNHGPKLPKQHPRQVPDQSIFRAYDIRGLVDSQLTETSLYWIARAVAAELAHQGHNRIALGWDGRHSSPALAKAAEQGLVEGGCRVLVLGEIPTGALYYATHETPASSGMMITGSHNPPEYNGIKLVFNQEAQSGEQLQALYQRIKKHDLPSGRGRSDILEIRENYLKRIESDVHISRDLRVVIDAGNGVAGPFAERLMEMLEIEVTPLYCDIDGDFPNHAPDPTEPDNLADLITIVKQTESDLGLAFDGDGDRVILVDHNGQIIWPDTTLMMLCDGLLQNHLGRSVVYDVKSTHHLGAHVRKLGGKSIVSPTGHSLMKATLKKHHALIGAEFSGHYYFADRWYGFDDGLYAAARILEHVAGQDGSLADYISRLPSDISTPEISLPCDDQRKFTIIEELAKDQLLKQGAKLITIDGLRIETRESWGLIRASNTTPRLTVRLSGETPAALENMHQRLVTALSAVDDSLGEQLEQAFKKTRLSS